MQVDNLKTTLSYTQIDIQKNNSVNKLTEEEASSLKIEIKSFQISVAKNALENFGFQEPKSFEEVYKDFQKALEEIGYEGKPIAELSQEEASELVSENGIFGIQKTSQRLSDFVINGASDDIDMLRAGREGIIQGYKEAEKLWGGELPEISKLTLEKALQDIDLKISNLGYDVINLGA